ncbi:MAG: hypothetical protein IPK60_11780 [Sandaracinaceae bacterium]|nr:hypothetical protein [Sandaracinaceae bacterium]
MSHPLRAFLLLVAYLLIANTAHAQQHEPEPYAPAPSWDSHLTVDVALLGPLGFFALEAEYAPVPEIGITAGIGVHQDGPQFGFMTRLRTVMGHSALGIGLGLSGGRNVDHEVDDDVFGRYPILDWGGGLDRTRTFRFRAFGNFEVAWERRSARGLYTRVSAGFEVPIADFSVAPVCDSECEDVRFQQVFPYAQFAVGGTL